MVARKMGDTVLNGIQNTGNCLFNGLQATFSGSATQDFKNTNTGSLDLAVLDKALASVKKGRPNLIVTNNVGRAYFKAAIRSTGTTAESLQMPNYGASFLQYDGIPIVVSDWIVPKDLGTAEFYCLYTNEVDGITLLEQLRQLSHCLGSNTKHKRC